MIVLRMEAVGDKVRVILNGVNTAAEDDSRDGLMDTHAPTLPPLLQACNPLLIVGEMVEY